MALYLHQPSNRVFSTRVYPAMQTNVGHRRSSAAMSLAAQIDASTLQIEDFAPAIFGISDTKVTVFKYSAHTTAS